MNQIIQEMRHYVTISYNNEQQKEAILEDIDQLTGYDYGTQADLNRRILDKLDELEQRIEALEQK